LLLARAQYVLRTIIDGGAFDTMDAVQQEFNHRLRMWSDSDERAAFDDGISARGAVPEHWYDSHPELRLMRLISKEGAQALQPYLRDGITAVVFDRSRFPGDGNWGQPASPVASSAVESSSDSASDSDELADTDIDLIVFAVSAQVENTRLRAEIEQLRAENQQLRNENAQLLQLPTPPSVSPSGASDASQAMAGLNIGDVYFGASR